MTVIAVLTGLILVIFLLISQRGCGATPDAVGGHGMSPLEAR